MCRASKLAGSTMVVIDLLRATSTICQALASGAAEVVPFLEIDDAKRLPHAAADRDTIVLGGEREGQADRRLRSGKFAGRVHAGGNCRAARVS